MPCRPPIHIPSFLHSFVPIVNLLSVSSPPCPVLDELSTFTITGVPQWHFHFLHSVPCSSPPPHRHLSVHMQKLARCRLGNMLLFHHLLFLSSLPSSSALHATNTRKLVSTWASLHHQSIHPFKFKPCRRDRDSSLPMGAAARSISRCASVNFTLFVRKMPMSDATKSADLVRGQLLLSKWVLQPMQMAIWLGSETVRPPPVPCFFAFYRRSCAVRHFLPIFFSRVQLFFAKTPSP